MTQGNDEGNGIIEFIQLSTASRGFLCVGNSNKYFL